MGEITEGAVYSCYSCNIKDNKIKKGRLTITWIKITCNPNSLPLMRTFETPFYASVFSSVPPGCPMTHPSRHGWHQKKVYWSSWRPFELRSWWRGPGEAEKLFCIQLWSLILFFAYIEENSIPLQFTIFTHHSTHRTEQDFYTHQCTLKAFNASRRLWQFDNIYIKFSTLNTHRVWPC